jgi:hypothetical protein
MKTGEMLWQHQAEVWPCLQLPLAKQQRFLLTYGLKLISFIHCSGASLVHPLPMVCCNRLKGHSFASNCPNRILPSHSL